MIHRIVFSLALLLTTSFLTAGPTESANETSWGVVDQNQSVVEKEETWTILIYGSCDSNLSDALVCDLEKNETVGSSDTFRIVVQADFDSTMEKDNTEAGLPPELSYGVTRFLLEKSDDPDHLTTPPLERLPELQMDDPRVLLDFLNWGFKKFPADHYGIVFSNHGGGWGGFGWDGQDSREDYDSRGLKVFEMATLLRRAMTTHKIEQIDFVAYDACLMSGIEVIDYFDGLCHYFIGDPEVDCGDGWNYGPALGWLKEHPNAPMDQFAKVEVDAWTALHMEDGKDGDLTIGVHSAIDMTKYPQVKKDFYTFCQTITEELSPDNLILPKMRRMAAEYGADTTKAPGETAEMIDLGNFARGFAQSKEVSPNLQKKAKALADSIDAMVTAKIVGVDQLGVSGLSIWYPVFHNDEEADEEESEESEEDEDEYYYDDEDEYYADDEEYYDDDEYYSDDDDDEEWIDTNSLEEIAQERFQDYYQLSLFRKSTLWPDYLKAVSVSRENFNEDELMAFAETAYKTLSPGEPFATSITINESAGAFQLHGTLLKKSSKTPKRCTLLGEVITANLNGSGKYKLHWTPNLHYLRGENGKSTPLALDPLNSIGNYWVACAEYQETPDDDAVDIQIRILFDQGQGKIVSVLQDGEGLSPIPVEMAPGGIITPDYWNEVRKGNDPDRWKGKYITAKRSVTIPPEGLKGLTIQTQPLPAGKYTLEFEVENVNAEVSDPFEVPLIIQPKDSSATDKK